ncbi:hypothetical protein PHYC_00650 [Phycisphaerales bacterium]|nr:hypothetical protein PHYC_00650 [Phycisphaerales bacterium]
MSRTGGSTRISSNAPYALVSTRPLHILVFLIPLMIAYEIGSIAYLSGGARGADTIGARSILGSFFNAFGAASLHVPPIALVVVLLAWHILLHDPWRVRPKVLAGMSLEAALWAVPLLVFSLFVARGTPGAGFSDAPLGRLPWQADLSIALGAGIYEELLFRLLLITAAHLILVDLIRFPDRFGFFVASLVSAVTFAFYHNVWASDGGLDGRKVLFFGVAGLYFAGVFITRGFGIVVAAHAMYDIVALLAFPPAR